jgi:ABC-type polysaccharide/polyol phosphate transport system ATPase subunit
MLRLQLCQASLTLPGRPSPFSLAGIAAGPLFAAPTRVLDSVCLDVADGDCVGLRARPGQPASVLLRLLAGRLAPTAGSRQVRGSVSSILDLGDALDPELTGTQNLQRLAPDRADEAAALSGLGELLDVPVRACSPGMQWRLAFAAAAAPADVLIVGDVLGAADLAYRPVALARLLWLLERCAAAVIAEPTLFGRCSRLVELAGARLREARGERLAA